MAPNRWHGWTTTNLKRAIERQRRVARNDGEQRWILAAQDEVRRREAAGGQERRRKRR